MTLNTNRTLLRDGTIVKADERPRRRRRSRRHPNTVSPWTIGLIVAIAGVLAALIVFMAGTP